MAIRQRELRAMVSAYIPICHESFQFVMSQRKSIPLLFLFIPPFHFKVQIIGISEVLSTLHP